MIKTLTVWSAENMFIGWYLFRGNCLLTQLLFVTKEKWYQKRFINARDHFDQIPGYRLYDTVGLTAGAFAKIMRQWDFSVNSHQYCGYDDKVVCKGTGMFRKSLLCNLHSQGKTQYTKTLTPYHMRHVVVSYHDEVRILTYCCVTSMVRLIKAGGLTSHPPKGLQADWTSHHSLYVSRDDPHFA